VQNDAELDVATHAPQTESGPILDERNMVMIDPEIAGAGREFDCTLKPDGDYPAADPSKYFTCSNQLTIGPRDCPAGLHWWIHPSLEGVGRCDWPHIAGRE
jgi:hypothetical protein